MKKILYLFLLLLPSVPVLAQCSPTSLGNIGAGGYNASRTTCGQGDDFTDVNTVTCGSTYYLGGEDELLSFTVATTGAYQFTMTGATSSDNWLGMKLYDACPLTSVTPNAVCVANSTSSSSSSTTFTISLTAGITYYLITDTFPSPDCANYTLNIANVPTPSCNPTSLGTIGTAGYNANRSTCGQGNDFTSSNTVTCGSTSYLGGEDELLSFMVSTTNTYKLTMTGTTSSDNWLGMKLYNGCPLLVAAPSGACVGESSSSTNVTYFSVTLTAGVTYYLITDTYPSPNCANYNLSIALAPPPPANDNCAGAIALPSIPTDATCASATYNTADATQSQAGCAGTADDDVWFSFVAPAGGAVDISLANTSGSTDCVHEVFSGTCAGLVSIDCSDPESNSITGLTAGLTYYIRIYTYSSAVLTTGTLCVKTPPPPPVNDECSAATSITVAQGSCTSPTIGYNNDATTSSQTAPTCALFSGGDVWYSFVVPSSGSVIVETSEVSGSNVGDTGLEVYSGTCGSLISIECNDDGGSGLFSLVAVSGQTPGSTLYARVWEYGNNSFGEFGICAYDTTTTGGGGFGNCPPDYTLINTETDSIDYETNGVIITISAIESGAVIDYDSNIYIDLLQGFWAKEGSNVAAFIDTCDGGYGGLIEPAAAKTQTQTTTTVAAKAFNIAPNPTSNIANVDFAVEKNAFVQVELYDVQGRKIQTLFQDRVEGGMPYQVQVEGDNLPNGLYIIRLISDNDMVQTRKLMIQH